MLRQLTVVQFPQGKNYVPGIRLAGKYLEQFNFKRNDKVIIEIEADIITIKKATAQETISQLIELNPKLKTLIQKFSLSPVVK